ncbi:MAG: aminopeptidase P family protein [Lachnospiraceae bacterium]|nr:aminopeptidase P family protein [Lachnospiraceae bacterium]
MNERIVKLLADKGLDALLVSGAANMRYLAGFTGEGYVVFTKRGQYVLTDSRYTVAAEEEAPGFQVIEVHKPYPEELSVLFAEDEKVGFEGEKMLYADFEGIRDGISQICLSPIAGELDVLRQVKEQWEIDRIAKAEEIGDKAFDAVLGFLKPGLTELEVAAFLEYQMKRLGAEDLSFNTIAAAGLNSAKPHAVPGTYRLQEGDFLTMDYGALYQGYHSDMTRTVVIGKASEEQKKIYHIVLEAQLAGVDALRAGLRGCDVDKVSRDIIANAGYGANFGHGLGHCVGLEIHESPRLSPKDETVLLPNMVITVEPGIYIKGFGGVRIEDTLVVKEGGSLNLAHSPKKLIEI